MAVKISNNNSRLMLSQCFGPLERYSWRFIYSYDIKFYGFDKQNFNVMLKDIFFLVTAHCVWFLFWVDSTPVYRTLVVYNQVHTRYIGRPLVFVYLLQSKEVWYYLRYKFNRALWYAFSVKTYYFKILLLVRPRGYPFTASTCGIKCRILIQVSCCKLL